MFNEVTLVFRCAKHSCDNLEDILLATLAEPPSGGTSTRRSAPRKDTYLIIGEGTLVQLQNQTAGTMVPAVDLPWIFLRTETRRISSDRKKIASMIGMDGNGHA